jgi:hypothetical protein
VRRDATSREGIRMQERGDRQVARQPSAELRYEIAVLREAMHLLDDSFSIKALLDMTTRR